MSKIEVIVSPQGEVTVETTGFKGKSCQDATRQLEQALGVVAGEQKKPEFYATNNGTLNA
jgi:hypothetical protein